MNTATLDLTNILRKLANEGVHVTTIDDTRYLVVAGTTVDDAHPYAVALTIDEFNVPTTNQAVSLTGDGKTPRRTWRTRPAICNPLSIGDVMAMAESVYSTPGWVSLRRCVDRATMSIWHLGIQPTDEHLRFFMLGAVECGELQSHASSLELARLREWISAPEPDPTTVQTHFAVALHGRLAARLEKRAHQRQPVAA